MNNQSVAALRTQLADLEKRVARLESYHLATVPLVRDMADDQAGRVVGRPMLKTGILEKDTKTRASGKPRVVFQEDWT